MACEDTKLQSSSYDNKRDHTQDDEGDEPRKTKGYSYGQNETDEGLSERSKTTSCGLKWRERTREKREEREREEREKMGSVKASAML